MVMSVTAEYSESSESSQIIVVNAHHSELYPLHASAAAHYQYPPSDPDLAYDSFGCFTSDGLLQGQHQHSLVPVPSGYLHYDDCLSSELVSHPKEGGQEVTHVFPTPVGTHGHPHHQPHANDLFHLQDPAMYLGHISPPPYKQRPPPPSLAILGQLAYSPGARNLTLLSSSFLSSDIGTPTSSIHLDTNAASSSQVPPPALAPNPKAGQDMLKLPSTKRSARRAPSPKARQGVLKLPLTKRSARRKPAIACLFCRERKIACGAPPMGSADPTCNLHNMPVLSIATSPPPLPCTHQLVAPRFHLSPHANPPPSETVVNYVVWQCDAPYVFRPPSPSILLADLTTNPFRTIPAAQPMARRRNDDFSADASVARGTWLASAIHTHHVTIPDAVSDQASVGSGKVKGNYIRSLRKVTDKADVVLLVLDPHVDRGRGKLVEEQARGGSRSCSTRLAFAEGPSLHDPSDSLPLAGHRLTSPLAPHWRSPPPFRSTRAAGDGASFSGIVVPRHPRARELASRTKELYFVQLERVVWIVNSSDSEYRVIMWSVLLCNMVKPEDLDDPTFFGSTRGHFLNTPRPTLWPTLRPFSHPSRLHWFVNSTASDLVVLSKETKLTPQVQYAPDFRRAGQFSAVQPTARRRSEGSEQTLPSFAWLTASATVRDIPSTVLGQTSVGSGEMKGHYIRTLDVVLLVLDVHDRAAATASWSRWRCEVEDKRLVFVFNKIDPVPCENAQDLPPPHDRNDTLPPHGPGPVSPLALCTRLAGHDASLLDNVGKGNVRSVASQVVGRMKELRSVQLEHVLQIVDSPETKERSEKWSNRKILTTPPPTVFCTLLVSAPFQHSSTARRGDPRAHTS
ncbi:hypothetical protein EDB83DRAFT_2317365 [Lactarius deliciosus]|nr:hypothetical protein EDB83DRAFT_2317365 [Lactarius deliciosus]